MAIDKPEKLDVETYLTTALSATPQELHPFFEAFQSLHQRKYAYTHLLISLYSDNPLTQN